jgi:hypothetical protein
VEIVENSEHFLNYIVMAVENMWKITIVFPQVIYAKTDLPWITGGFPQLFPQKIFNWVDIN